MEREHSRRAPGVFGTRVRHFFSRFFDTESLSPQGEPEAGVIQTLGILAVPSAFFVLLFRPLTLTGWNLVKENARAQTRARLRRSGGPHRPHARPQHPLRSIAMLEIRGLTKYYSNITVVNARELHPETGRSHRLPRSQRVGQIDHRQDRH